MRGSVMGKNSDSNKEQSSTSAGSSNSAVYRSAERPLNKNKQKNTAGQFNMSFRNKKNSGGLILEQADEEEKSSDDGSDSDAETRRIVLGNQKKNLMCKNILE